LLCSFFFGASIQLRCEVRFEANRPMRLECFEISKLGENLEPMDGSSHSIDGLIAVLHCFLREIGSRDPLVSGNGVP
jgi:hypothetical protein